MRVVSRIPAPDNSVFGCLGSAPDATVNSDQEVKVGDRVIGHVVGQVVAESGLAIELTIEVDDEWANSVGLGNLGAVLGDRLTLVHQGWGGQGA